MNRAEKDAEIQWLKDSFTKANAVIFADYKGVASNDMNDLRSSMRELDIEFKVIKNNLVRKALAGTNKEAAVENLVGPTAALFNFGDAAAAAKALNKFSKDNDAFVLKDGFLGEEAIGEAQIKQLADLPPKEVLLAQLLSVLQGPMRGFVTVLSAVQRDFVCVLQAVADKKKEEGGE